MARHIVESLYNVTNNEYRKNFEYNFSTNFYGTNTINNLVFHKKYGDYVMIINRTTKYICDNTNKYNYLCTCTCNDCFEETYSMAKIIGKYKTGEYQAVILFWYDPMQLIPDYSDIRKICYNDIVGIITMKEVTDRFHLIKQIENLPNSIYKAE